MALSNSCQEQADPGDRTDLLFCAEVVRFRASERRRSFPLGLHVGIPDGPRLQVDTPWPPPSGLDEGLRFDVADALVDELIRQWPVDRAAWAWLTRPGVAQLHDRDLEWFAAVVRAFGVHALPLVGFRAVTRSGWLDVVTGRGGAWKRQRR